MKKIWFIILLLLALTTNAQKIKVDTFSLSTYKILIDKFNLYDTISIDTSQVNILFIDRYSRSLYPIVNLGQIATPSLDLLFYEQKTNTKFYFFNFFDGFLNSNQQAIYYKTNKPYTDFYYLWGQKLVEEQYFDFLHTQSFKKDSINIGININLRSALNLQTTKDNNSINIVDVWFIRRYKMFDFYVKYNLNSLKFSETGGFNDTMQGFDFFSVNRQFNINSAYVKNNLKRTEFLVLNRFRLSSAMAIHHKFNFLNYKKIFDETQIQKIFGDPLINKQKSYDSISNRSIQNQLCLIYDFKSFKVSMGLENSLNSYYFFRGFLYNLKGDVFVDNNVFVSFVFKNRFFEIRNFAKYHFTSRYSSNIEQNLSANLIVFKQLRLNIIQSFDRYTPDYFLENYNGNYQRWSQQLDRVTELKTDANLVFNKTNSQFGLKYSHTSNYIYFDSSLVPLQYNNNLVVIAYYLKQKLNIRPLMFEFEAYYQQPNTQFINVPRIVAGGLLYFDFALFRKALLLNVGLQASYASQFYQYAYSPTLGVFYLSQLRYSSNLPYTSVFLTAKIKTAIVVIRIDNPAGAAYKPYYATVEHYIAPILNFRFGLRWWFRN